ncbi:hypothetical protein D3C76_1267160 [compost metagenome]
MAEYQHGGLRVSFKDFRNASERAERHRQEHGRAVRVERALYGRGHHQYVFTAFELQVAVLDRCAQTRFVVVQPSLGDFRIGHRHGFGCALLFATKRPPPLAICISLSLGLGHFDRLGCRFYFWFFIERFLGTERPVPRAGTLSLGNRRGSWFQRCRGWRWLLGRDFVGRPERPPAAAVYITFRSLCATCNSEAQCQGEGGFG